MSSSSAAVTSRPSRGPIGPSTPIEWVAGTGAFAVEIALVVAAAVVGHRLGTRLAGPVGGWVGALVAVTAMVRIWARWMAPTADRRLGPAGRLVVGTALIALTALGLARTGSTAWALVLGIGGIA